MCAAVHPTGEPAGPPHTWEGCGQGGARASVLPPADMAAIPAARPSVTAGRWTLSGGWRCSGAPGKGPWRLPCWPPCPHWAQPRGSQASTQTLQAQEQQRLPDLRSWPSRKPQWTAGRLRPCPRGLMQPPFAHSSSLGRRVWTRWEPSVPWGWRGGGRGQDSPGPVLAVGSGWLPCHCHSSRAGTMSHSSRGLPAQDLAQRSNPVAANNERGGE